MKQGAYDYLTKPFKVDEIARSSSARSRSARSSKRTSRCATSVAGRARARATSSASRRAMQQRLRADRQIALDADLASSSPARAAPARSWSRARSTATARAREQAVRRGQLRRDPRGAARERAVRPREGRVHRRDRRQRRACSQEADGGTLFLDEIGELPLGAAGRSCCACCRSARSSPVGGDRASARSTCASIAATNRDLEAEVARGAFRAGPLLPAQRHRAAPAAAARARARTSRCSPSTSCARFGAEHGRAVAALAARRCASSSATTCPATSASSRTSLERAVALGVERADRRERSARGERTRSRPVDAAGEFPTEGVDLERLVGDFEREWVMRALEQTGGVRKRAATLLGISVPLAALSPRQARHRARR